MKKMGLISIVNSIVISTCLLVGCGGGDEINALEYIELGQYTNLPVTKMDTTVTDEDVDAQLETLVGSMSTMEKIEDRDIVQVDDFANIDYEGSIDGVTFEGGTAEGYDLQIGSRTFIDGFEEALIGAKVGDTLDVEVTFPEEYHKEELAGKPAVFKVTINYLSKEIIPELTDEFVKEQTQGQYNTVDEVREFIRDQMTTTFESYANSAVYTSLLTQAIENATIIKDIPEDYLNARKEGMIRTAKSNAEAYGVSFETYLDTYMGMDEDTFYETVDGAVEDIAKQSLVVAAIAETEKLSVSDEEFDARVEEMLEEYGYSGKDTLFESITEEDLRETMLTEKVEEFMMAEAEVTVE